MHGQTAHGDFFAFAQLCNLLCITVQSSLHSCANVPGFVPKFPFVHHYALVESVDGQCVGAGFKMGMDVAECLTAKHVVLPPL